MSLTPVGILEWRTHRKDANVLIFSWIQLGAAKLFLSQSPDASQSSWSNLEGRASSSEFYLMVCLKNRKGVSQPLVH